MDLTSGVAITNALPVAFEFALVELKNAMAEVTPESTSGFRSDPRSMNEADTSTTILELEIMHAGAVYIQRRMPALGLEALVRLADYSMFLKPELITWTYDDFCQLRLPIHNVHKIVKECQKKDQVADTMILIPPVLLSGDPPRLDLVNVPKEHSGTDLYSCPVMTYESCSPFEQATAQLLRDHPHAFEISENDFGRILDFLKRLGDNLHIKYKGGNHPIILSCLPSQVPILVTLAALPVSVEHYGGLSHIEIGCDELFHDNEYLKFLKDSQQIYFAPSEAFRDRTDGVRAQTWRRRQEPSPPVVSYASPVQLEGNNLPRSSIPFAVTPHRQEARTSIPKALICSDYVFDQQAPASQLDRDALALELEPVLPPTDGPAGLSALRGRRPSMDLLPDRIRNFPIQSDLSQISPTYHDPTLLNSRTKRQRPNSTFTEENEQQSAPGRRQSLGSRRSSNTDRTVRLQHSSQELPQHRPTQDPQPLRQTQEPTPRRFSQDPPLSTLSQWHRQGDARMTETDSPLPAAHIDPENF